ncbi:hypothetical protein J2W27_000333 [Variovorax boronicumulans]|uniref:caspase family protein n=1 Tax=Variovorax boronicumulans TaxID=436515 RepID=UPI00277E4932|nr:caspase family protein [Variovorax boronicumulans]MDP9908240.1 hypothetical protein [Variovorax boronicumulans]
MNIAILLGVSTYVHEQALPACAHDVNNMHQLLGATGKYDEILLIKDSTKASTVKSNLRDFFGKYQNREDVDEVFFYFSGHGMHHNDEALLCCSDFDYRKPSTTSVGSGELDDLIRSVSPAVAVKVIDACQSGSPYIKDSGLGFEKALSKTPLKSFICMASSRQDQNSFATAQESFFTRVWIDAALTRVDGAVLYRDIQAALADEFVDTPEQTPFFVNQGSGLEAFGVVTEAMRMMSNARLTISDVSMEKGSVVELIAERVAEKDKEFVSQASVIQAVESSKTAILNEEIDDRIISHFYSLKISVNLKLAALPNVEEVARFAKKQFWEKSNFVKLIEEGYQAKIRKNSIAGMALGLTTRHLANRSISDDDFYIEDRVRPINVEATETLPFEVAELIYASSHPSLPEFRIYIGLVHSLTELTTLSATIRLIQKGWESRAAELPDVSWRYHTQMWRSVVASPMLIYQEAKSRGESDIRAYLESLVPKVEESAGATESSANP